MTPFPFVYSRSLLNECAESNVASSLLPKGPNAPPPDDCPFETSFFVEISSNENDKHTTYDESCTELWKSYKHHYGIIESDEAGFKSHYWVDKKGKRLVAYLLGPRVERFLRSVMFIRDHNNDSSASHQVTLNRFSASETFHMFSESDFEASRRRITEVQADLGIGHGAKNILHRHRSKHTQAVPVKKIVIPDSDRKPFETPFVGSDLNGFLLSIKRSHFKEGANHAVVGDANVSPNKYKRFLNWASHDNPDGVPIVHDAFDQESCGSCWAFAAAGSLEASASRRAAFIAYDTYRTSRRNPINVNLTVEEEAIAVAQRVQRRAMKVLNLSVQELLDCDSITDQGCVGGNPLLAFYYIHQNGLVSWEDYPYKAKADTCEIDATQNPVATVKSWGMIQSNHEKHMELALRYIGPIAVGINGDNNEFLAYSGGIFDSPRCKQKANHALLIVGYGEEENRDGEIVKYWIARNRYVTNANPIVSKSCLPFALTLDSYYLVGELDGARMDLFASSEVTGIPESLGCVVSPKIPALRWVVFYYATRRMSSTNRVYLRGAFGWKAYAHILVST
eukprot:scaffold1230_cov166-Amphora_coffeaeformis.AAC.6